MADDYPTMTVSVSVCQTDEAARLSVCLCTSMCECADVLCTQRMFNVWKHTIGSCGVSGFYSVSVVANFPVDK